MHAKIISLIDELVKISGEKENIKNLKEELIYLDNLLPELKNELHTLELSITDDKYFDASSEIIDRNIEISLKKKISNLQDLLNKEKDKCESLSKKEEEIISKYDILNKRMVSCESFIEILNNRVQNDADYKYSELLDQEKKHYESLIEQEKEIKNQKKEISTNLDKSQKNLEELENKIESEKKQLQEIQNNLSSKSSYIDNRKKDEDLNKVKEIELKIENAEKRKNEIIETITYKAEQAKELLLNSKEDKTEFLNYINSITNELNNIPYQKIEDEVILKEELHQLESKKDELTTLLENKKYASQDIELFETRSEYLDSKKIFINKSVECYKTIENTINNEEIIRLSDILMNLREQAKIYEILFNDYLNDFDKGYEEELEKYNLINNLIINYEEDLQNLIVLSNKLGDTIANCEKQIVNINEENEELNRKKLLHKDSINIIEKEKDRKELKEIIESIDKINIRLSMGITPNQVLDQIEMLLFADSNKLEEIVKEPVEDIVNEEIIINDMPEEEPSGEIEISEDTINNQEVIKNLDLNINNEIHENKLSNNVEFTFEKLPQEEKPTLEEMIPEEMIINPQISAEIFNEPEENQDYSFSPLDNTGFMSFEDALTAAQKE